MDAQIEQQIHSSWSQLSCDTQAWYVHHFLTSFDPVFERLSDKLPWSAPTNLFWCKEDRYRIMHHPYVYCSEAMDIVLSMLAETVAMPLMCEIEYMDSMMDQDLAQC